MSFPFRALDCGFGVEHRHGSCFVATSLFRVDCADARMRRGRGAMGLGRLAQRGLISLELNDQMRVGSGFERFFWQCIASQVTMWPARLSSANSF